MEFYPSEKEVVINPITGKLISLNYIGKTMVGANIKMNISPNKPKEDELVYSNRLKIHYKGYLNGVGATSKSSAYGNIGFNVSSLLQRHLAFERY